MAIEPVKGQLLQSLMLYLGGRIDAADRKFLFVLTAAGLVIGLKVQNQFKVGTLDVAYMPSVLCAIVALLVAVAGQIGWFRHGGEVLSKLLNGQLKGEAASSVLDIDERGLAGDWAANLELMAGIVRWKTRVANVALLLLAASMVLAAFGK